MSHTSRSGPLISELQAASHRLEQLLVDPHPGLVTWTAAVASAIDAIAGFNAPRSENLAHWVSVAERLPHGIEKALLLHGEHEMLIMGIYNSPNAVFLGWDDEAEDWREIPNRVTHWMVIPETPK